MIFILVILTIIVGLVVDSVVQYKKKKNVEGLQMSSPFTGNFNEESVTVPKGVFSDKGHTWVHMDKNGDVRVGINDFLQHVTGPISRIEMKNTGEQIRKGDVLFTIIQEGKHLDIYAPISGTIKEQNQILKTISSLLNSSPYQDGWVYIIEPTNWFKETQFMIMYDNHREWIKKEFARLKEFFNKFSTPGVERVVMQDGGTLRKSALAYYGPEVWEEFQTNFLNAI